MLEFSDLQAIYASVTNPARQSFYRKLYGIQPGIRAPELGSLSDWRKLPPVTKDDLIAVSLSERSYLPLSQLDHLRASSGTSGKPPLFSPRTHVRRMEYRLKYHDFNRAFLAFSVPMMPHWHARFMAEHGKSPRVISYDPKYPRASVALAKTAGVDAFSVFVYHTSALGEEMKRVHMNQDIKFAEITGEVCSRAQYQYLRETFPNATIVQSYNSSEVEDAHIGMPCKPIDGSEPLALYHPKETHYLEIVDPETGAPIEPRTGAEGDLLITAYPGEPASFPLLRYRIGDTIRIVDGSCPHGTFSFTVLGRTELDFVKIPGGMLRADELARVLQLMQARVSDRFELHCYERETEHGSMIEPVLRLQTNETDLKSLAKEIAAQLRVSPVLTYAEGVALGRYLPLTCELLEAGSCSKAKRIVQHAN